jgi:nucleoside-diphosphate-sugar epimerase
MTKVFGTGFSGFIGSLLAKELIDQGHEVYALCRNVTDRKPALPEGVNIVWGDLIDPHHLKKSLTEINPEVVVHLAAQSSVAYSHAHSYENFSITVLGTVNLQKACEGLSNLEKFIFAGTSEEYGNQGEFPIRETSRLDFANQPYAIAKVAADKYLQYCKESTGFPTITLRPFNTYGRTRNFNFVTESIIYQMLTKDKVVLGSPCPTRDLLYASDHVNGYIKTIDTPFNKLQAVNAINICTGRETSIKQLAEKLAPLTHFSGEIVWGVKTRPTEIDRLVGSYSLAHKYIGWEPEYTLDEGLAITVENIKKGLQK